MKLEHALFLNEAFYLAFAQKDLEAMDNLWAREHPVVCVHPGWPALSDRADIMQTWQQILGNPQQPGIDFYDVEGHLVGDTAIVTCYEALPNGVCTASNGFVVERGEIRMFHHHAGQCVNPPEPSIQERGPLQ